MAWAKVVPAPCGAGAATRPPTALLHAPVASGTLPRMHTPGLLPPTLADVARALVDSSPRAEAWEGARVIPIATLDSGMRLGLGADAWWGITDLGHTLRCAEPNHYRFYEALEQTRDSFDAALEEGAAAAGLPPADVVVSFPAVEVVRAVLERESTFLHRKALLFLRASELRDARSAIVGLLGRAPSVPIRDLAERLVVPT